MKHGVLTVLKLDLPFYGDGIIGYTMGIYGVQWLNHAWLVDLCNQNWSVNELT